MNYILFAFWWLDMRLSGESTTTAKQYATNRLRARKQMQAQARRRRERRMSLNTPFE